MTKYWGTKIENKLFNILANNKSITDIARYPARYPTTAGNDSFFIYLEGRQPLEYIETA